MIKKIFSIIFLIFAFIISITEIIRLPEVIGNIIGPIKMFSGELNDYETGLTLGHFIGQMFIIVLVSILILFGIKWIKRKNIE